MVLEALGDKLAAEAGELLAHEPSDDRATVIRIAAAREIRAVIAEIEEVRKEVQDARD